MSCNISPSRLYLCGMIRAAIVFLILCVISSRLPAQQKSNRGKEFWLGYGHNILFTYPEAGVVNSQQLAIYISTEEAATVTVSVNGTSFSQTVNIPANSVDASILIPKTGPDDARIISEGAFNRGIRILSNVPIVAYAHQYGAVSSAATMLMPVETFGYTYYSLNFAQTTNYGVAYSWFYAIASEDNTRLQITPSDTTENGWLPGNTYTVNLQKGQIYNVFGKRNPNGTTGKDLTGSKIISVTGADGNCHPVGVFCGSSRNVLLSSNCITTYSNGAVGNGNGGEILMQQMLPANAWGTKYITYHTINNSIGDIQSPFLNLYRVAVRDPATIVKRNGQVLSNLQRGFYYEFRDSAGSVIESNQPILVAQYPVNSRECVGVQDNPLGDPEMIYISPIEQGIKKIILFNARREAINVSMINIIVPTAGLNSLLIDGTSPTASESLPHPIDPNYSVVARRYLGAAGFRSVTCQEPFIATVYGVGTSESYGYNAGTFVNNLNAFTSFKNKFGTAIADTVTCPKAPIELSLQLAYKANQIQWRFSQAGGGINPSIDITESNPQPTDSTFINGRRYYQYTLSQSYTFAQPGQYRIPVTYAASDLDACNQTETIYIDIRVGDGPRADFTVQGKGCVGESIVFNGNPQSNGFNLNAYRWQFSDNSTASTLNTTKTFTSPGTQNISFTVFASNGCVHDTVKVVQIEAIPTAQIRTSASSFCNGKPILFEAISSGNINQWNWNLGNANSNQAPPFNHTYSLAGSYNTSLQVSSPNGCLSLLDQQTILIGSTPLVNAGPDLVIKKGESTTLQGTIANGGNYSVIWTPNLQLSQDTILQPIASPTRTTTYILRAADRQRGCTGQDSMQVQVITQLAIPNAFSPNRDGHNDVWELPGIALYPNAIVSIYNRWGQKIYSTTQYERNPWDGTLQGITQPNGIYVYVIQLNNTEKEVLRGNLVLVR